MAYWSGESANGRTRARVGVLSAGYPRMDYIMNRFIPLSAVALSAAMLMPLSAQAAVNDPTSIPTGESAVRVLSTLAVAD